MSVCVYSNHYVPAEVTRRCQIPGNWSYELLEATMTFWGSKPEPSIKAGSAFTCWTTFLDQRFLFNTTKNCGIYIFTIILQSFTSYRPCLYFISWVRITKDSVGCGCHVSSLLEATSLTFLCVSCLRTCSFSSFPGIWHFRWRLRSHFWLTGVCLWQA